MAEQTKSIVMQAWIDQVKAQINGDMYHGWNADDSMAVIEAVIAADAEDQAVKKPGLELKKFTASEESLGLIKEVVNPSAFRQKLESKGKLTKKEPAKKGTTNMFDSI